ncbi:hypothetical protein [Flavobacterium sp.]|jgi:hypothetical protein|uniref:hypothetical protein n=1 Tax=Flavobacterium sp. TaxID=239 RepID=UPI0037BE491E
MDINFDELISEENLKYFNINDIEISSYVDLSEELLPPDTLLSIGEHTYKGNSYPTSLCTSSEFSAIIAESKKKKSFIKSAFIASFIGGNTNQLFPNIKSHRKEDFTILDFDTEQGAYYAQRTFRRVNDMVGSLYTHYKCYITRNLPSEQRLKLIDYCLSNQNKLYDKKVKFVAIDGIADLIENTNDIVMSKQASDYLTKWTYEYGIHIMTVIHKSGTTGKPLGHLGTYVLKKAENVISLEQNEDGSINVSNPFSRGYRFEDFNFDVNSNGLPYLIE